MDAALATPTAESVARAYRPRLVGHARRLLGNEHDAEDVAQDVLVQVVQKLGTFRGRSSLSTWLHAVTANAARDFRRRRATRPARGIDPGVLDAVPAAGGSGPDDRVLAREARGQVGRAVAGLPAGYKEVFVLADVQGRSHAAVGAALGLSPQAVKARSHRARAMVREALALYHGGAA